MNLFGEDAIIGDFKLSDFGLMLASFDSGDVNIEDELGKWLWNLCLLDFKINFGVIMA